jgi:hypothetical protein
MVSDGRRCYSKDRKVVDRTNLEGRAVMRLKDRAMLSETCLIGFDLCIGIFIPLKELDGPLLLEAA